jgi:prevent-host-death family protein
MTMKRARRTIAAAEFKAHCLAILDEISATKETVVVTKRGKPVAKVVAVEDDAQLRPLRGSVRYRGDIVAPIDEPWDALP